MCFRTDERRLNVKNCEGARSPVLSHGPLRVQRLMLEFAGEDDACRGRVDICLESTEIFSFVVDA